MTTIPHTKKISDMHFMIHTMNNLPDGQDVVLDSIENRLMFPINDPNKLKIEDVRAKLNHQYDRIHKINNEDSDDKDGENKEVVAFYTKQFKVNCRNCRKYGHKSYDCTEKKEGTTKCT